MLHDKNLKYKFIDITGLYRILDRLTRPKPTEEKFSTVFNSILSKYLIEPKYCKQQLDSMDINEKKRIFTQIWNNSVSELCRLNSLPIVNTGFINNILSTEEEKMFNITSGKTYFDEILNIENLTSLPCPLDPVPINIKRILNINKKTDTIKLRQEKALKFPIEKIIVTEGITEEILLPVFAKLLDYDFNQNGVHLISAGGKNQVARWYLKNKDIFKTPIFILLDSDAQEIAHNINNFLLPKDFIYLIQNGEFEDIIPQKLIKKTINDNFKNDFQILVSDLRTDTSMCKVLKQIFYRHHVGDFKKAEFARLVSEELKKLPCFSEEIYKIITTLKKI